MAPKKSMASKRPRGSSSSNYDRTRFVSADAEGRFHALVTKRLGIKEWGFEIDSENARVEGFHMVIQNQGWQLFCKHPKTVAMTVVREFFANAPEGPSNYKVLVRGKEVKYDTTTINNLLRLQYNPTNPDEVEYLLNDNANMAELTGSFARVGVHNGL